MQTLETTQPSATYRLALALAAGTGLFLVLAAGALGIIGDGGREDRMYVGVLAVLVIGSAIARLKAREMTFVLCAAALAMAVCAVIAFANGWHELPGASVLEILGLTALFAGLFGASGWLFWRSGASV
ncbi:MAG TPA: hypothetical protein VFK52_09175 [Nocardioidaceae bacterium]|nr:hypothetical protein [Nocardioidaceae bacterium]